MRLCGAKGSIYGRGMVEMEGMGIGVAVDQYCFSIAVGLYFLAENSLDGIDIC